MTMNQMKLPKITAVVFLASLALILVSCNFVAISEPPVTSSSLSPEAERIILSSENDALKRENGRLVPDNAAMQTKIASLESELGKANELVDFYQQNLQVAAMLDLIAANGGQVTKFPAILQNIRIEKINNADVLVFSIDRMIVNPEWQGPGTGGGKGYLLNETEVIEEVRGDYLTNFNDLIIQKQTDKMAQIIAAYQPGTPYFFYLAAETVVLVLEAGP